MITVKGQLTDAGGNPIKLGIIDCVSINNLGRSFINSSSMAKADGKGFYEFQLKIGEYRVYAQVNMRSDVDLLGKAHITSDMDGETYTLEDILDFSDAVAPPIIEEIRLINREVQDHLFEVKELHVNVGVWHESVLSYRDEVVSMHHEVNDWYMSVHSMHSDVESWHSETQSLRDQAEQFAQNSGESASKSAQSEQNAKQSEQNAKQSELNAATSESNSSLNADESRVSADASERSAQNSEQSSINSESSSRESEQFSLDSARSANESEESSQSSDFSAIRSEQHADRSEAAANDLDTATRFIGFFTPSAGYPPPPALGVSYNWICAEDGEIDGEPWGEGETLFYAPNPSNPSTFGQYQRRAGSLIGDSNPKPIEISDDLIMQIEKRICFRDTIGGLVQAMILDGNNDLLIGNAIPSSKQGVGFESIGNLGVGGAAIYHVLSQDENGLPLEVYELLSTNNGVTNNTNQSIGGDKTFTGRTVMGGDTSNASRRPSKLIVGEAVDGAAIPFGIVNNRNTDGATENAAVGFGFHLSSGWSPTAFIDARTTSPTTTNTDLVIQTYLDGLRDVATFTASGNLSVIGGYFQDGVQNAAANSLTRRDYVDGLDNENVKLSGEQVIDGSKHFTIPPIAYVYPSQADHLTRKDYVDEGLAGKASSSHTHTMANISDLSPTTIARTNAAINCSSDVVAYSGSMSDAEAIINEFTQGGVDSYTALAKAVEVIEAMKEKVDEHESRLNSIGA